MKTSDKNGIVVTAIKRLLQFLLLQVVFLVAMNLAVSIVGLLTSVFFYIECMYFL